MNLLLKESFDTFENIKKSLDRFIHAHNYVVY